MLRYLNIETKEFFQITTYDMSKSDYGIIVQLVHAFMKDGMPDKEDISLSIYNLPPTGRLLINPGWKERPEGFDENDPRTWKTAEGVPIPWESIPKSLPLTTDYDEVMSAIKSGTSEEEAIITKLAQIGKLPTIGFSITRE